MLERSPEADGHGSEHLDVQRASVIERLAIHGQGPCHHHTLMYKGARQNFEENSNLGARCNLAQREDIDVLYIAGLAAFHFMGYPRKLEVRRVGCSAQKRVFNTLLDGFDHCFFDTVDRLAYAP